MASDRDLLVDRWVNPARLGRGSDILKCVNEVNQEHEVSPASAVVIDVRGGRYGEVFLLDTSSPTVTADVYNSYGLNDCPQDLWSALDPKQLAVDNGVGLVMLNGPRCWLMDNITKVQDLAQPREIRNFGGIDMFKAATLMIGDITAPPGPYSPRAVDRRTVFSFDHGSQIYELVDPAGTRWVMQSWSQQADPRLSVNDLPGIGARLHLPEGWTYVVSTLSSVLQVDTTTVEAAVLQDDLLNSYSRLTA